MKTIAVFHPSAELHGADRIMVSALKAIPNNIKKKVYLFRHGPLESFLTEQVENVEIQIRNDMPVIYRSIFTPSGIIKTIVNIIHFFLFVKNENKTNNFVSAYVNTSSNVLLLPILKLLGIKRYIHIHEIIDSPKIIGWFTAFVSRWFATRVICVSGAVQLGLMRYVRSIKRNSTIIHNGIDAVEIGARTEKIIPTDNGITASILRFYLFGRIQERKGHWFLIEALSLLPKSLLKQTKFVMMGGVVPGQEHELERLNASIKKHQLSDVIEIKEFASNIGQAMTQAHVCLVPSLVKDSFPTTVLEAMSAGRPVIATNNGGAIEAILNNETGYLINPYNTQQLADCIASLVKDRDLVTRFGQEGEKRFSKHYTMQHFTKRWMRFIKENLMLDHTQIEINELQQNIPIKTTTALS